MRYISWNGLGRISQIGLGTARFGTVVDEDLSFELMDYYFEHGGNIIDTARNYYEWTENGRGKSEKTVGKWVSDRNVRNSILISTKGGVRNEKSVFISDLSKANLLNEAMESMDSLCTDYIDTYFLHRDEPTREVSEIMYTLAEVKDVTKCKLLGVSNWRIERIIEANEYAKEHGLPRIETIQTWWSIADPIYEMWKDPTVTWMDEDTYQYVNAKGLLTFAYTSQAKGFFQKAIKEGYDNIPELLKERIVSGENLRRLKKIEGYCKEHKVDPTSVVNGYITQNRIPAVALISCSSIAHLKEIIDSTDDCVDPLWLSQFDPIESV